MPSLLTKIIAGDIYRKTRFHDEKGNLIPFSQLCYLPLNITLFFGAKVFKKYPTLPWFPFNVLRHLKKIISKNWIMVEFGSGMSTLWFAKKVKFIYSIEHDDYWYNIVSDKIKDSKVSNVKYELRSLEEYSNLGQIINRSVDFVVIDGWARSKCILASLSKLKPGGYMYLDNSDKDMTVENGDMRTCEKILREIVKEKNGQLWEFTGLTVGMINSHQGILARL